MTHFAKGAARPRTKTSIIDAAKIVGCKPAMIAAFIEVEAAGSGFFNDGRLKVLPERHKVYELLPEDHRAGAVKAGLALAKWSPKTQYKDLKSADQCYAFFERVAEAYGAELAGDAASWGAGQVMGFNAAAVGYANAEAMIRAFADSEDAQIIAIAKFLKANRLDDEARAEDCYGLAGGYNGKGQINIYGPRLQTALARQKKLNWDTPASPTPPFAMEGRVDLGVGKDSSPEMIKALQKALNDKNYQAGSVDGRWGKLTRDAVLSFRADNHLDTAEQTLALDVVLTAKPRVLEMRADATVEDLRAKGSTTVAGADKVQVASLLGGAGAAGSSALSHLETAGDYWSRIKGVFEPFRELIPDWLLTNPFLYVLPIAGVAIYYAHRVKVKRLEEFKAGKLQ